MLSKNNSEMRCFSLSIEKLLRVSERCLKRTEAYQSNRELDMPPEENYQVVYFFIKGNKDAPEDVLVYANCMYDVLYFHPLQDNSFPVLQSDFQYSLSDDLFKHLENGYTLAYMTWEVHGFVWDEISQYHQYFGHPAGLQKYLEFCKRNGITRERLEKECSYEGWDILTLYDRQTAKTAPPKMRKDMER